jgi:hypothetical protein
MIKIDLSTLTSIGKNRSVLFDGYFDTKEGIFYYTFPKLKTTEIFQETI